MAAAFFGSLTKTLAGVIKLFPPFYLFTVFSSGFFLFTAHTHILSLLCVAQHKMLAHQNNADHSTSFKQPQKSCCFILTLCCVNANKWSISGQIMSWISFPSSAAKLSFHYQSCPVSQMMRTHDRYARYSVWAQVTVALCDVLKLRWNEKCILTLLDHIPDHSVHLLMMNPLPPRKKRKEMDTWQTLSISFDSFKHEASLMLNSESCALSAQDSSPVNSAT